MNAHIGIDARITGYRIGGISTVAVELVRTLHALDRENRYTVFTSRRNHYPLLTDTSPDDNFRESTLWTPPHHRFERVALSVELARHRLDVYHSVDFIPPKRGAKRHVITVHDLTFLHFPEHKDREGTRYYTDQIETAVEQADHILSVSVATKNDLMTMLNVPEHKITVQPNGVGAQYRPLSPDERLAWRNRLDLPEKYILFVGTIEPRKNLETLLDAYTLMESPPPLLIVGQTGWLADATLDKMKTLQASGYDIHHRTDITDEALPAVYANASVLALPSYYEGFGLPALEAMACGTPVVVSDRSSLPEIVGDAGLLVEPDDADGIAQALTQALHDDLWREESIRIGLARAQTFTWQNSARIAMFVYQSLLS